MKMLKEIQAKVIQIVCLMKFGCFLDEFKSLLYDWNYAKMMDKQIANIHKLEQRLKSFGICTLDGEEAILHN